MPRWPARTIKDRLLCKVQMDDRTGCWNWVAAADRIGYGRFQFNGAKLAHRVSYELHKGDIPGGLVLDHLCRNPRCINPDHLEAVPQAENMARGVGGVRRAEICARRTECKNGHSLSPENTYVLKGTYGPWRRCRRCYADRQAEYSRRKKLNIDVVTG